MKNLLDTCIGCLVFWVVGWNMAFDTGNPFVGRPIPYELKDDPGAWFHQYVYAAASSTIVSGAIAERTQTVAYLFHSVFMLCLIYPPVAHWIWSDSGWLSTLNPDAFLGGTIDFAGGAVVHLTGAPNRRPWPPNAWEAMRPTPPARP